MAEWSVNDTRTVALSNQKNIYVGVAAPGTAYDGQVWVCTSSDPPLVKVYDKTNTRWMEHHEVIYETVTSGQFPATTPVLNGAICVAYDTEQSSTTLFAYANGSWRDMGGALTRVYPLGDVVATETRAVGGVSLTIGENIDVDSGQTVVLTSTNITPNNSGDFVVAFLGGSVAMVFATASGSVRLHVGSVQVGSQAVSGIARAQLTICSGAVASNTSTNVYADFYQNNQSGGLRQGCIGIAVMSVKT